MGLLASRVHPRRRRRFSNPLGLEPRLSISLGHICFTDLLLRSPFSSLLRLVFLILVSRSPASTSRFPLHLCLSRPYRSPSPSLSLFFSKQLLSFFHHASSSLDFPLSLARLLSLLYLDSTRSLSGNERRNTLATFNRPALSSAYTYLASSAPLYPRPRPHLHPPPSCHPRLSPAYPRQAPTFRFLLLIFTTNIVYKYLRALSLVFRAFCYACLEPVFFFLPKNSKIETCETLRDFTNRLLAFLFDCFEEADNFKC